MHIYRFHKTFLTTSLRAQVKYTLSTMTPLLRTTNRQFAKHHTTFQFDFSNNQLQHCKLGMSAWKFTVRICQILLITENVWNQLKLNDNSTQNLWVNPTYIVIKVMAWHRFGDKPLPHLIIAYFLCYKELTIALPSCNESNHLVSHSIRLKHKYIMMYKHQYIIAYKNIVVFCFGLCSLVDINIFTANYVVYLPTSYLVS